MAAALHCVFPGGSLLPMYRSTLRLVLAVIIALVGWQILRAARSAWFEYGIFHRPRDIPAMPADAAGLGLQSVAFRSGDGTQLRGWYIASKTGATVVAVGGSNATRAAMLPYARILSAGGTGVLLFDWPGCGESEGKIGLGARERDAVRAAVAFASERPDVHGGRIGLLGFSVGAHFSLLAAADDPHVRALVLEGPFGSPWAQGMAEYRSRGLASQLGGLTGDLFGGMDWTIPDAALAASRISPRPLLIVAGARDHSVPAALSREVFENAREPKAFWLIEGAEHGEYLTADPTYAPRLRAFVERALAQ